jgi:hypothetical protein
LREVPPRQKAVLRSGRFDAVLLHSCPPDDELLARPDSFPSRSQAEPGPCPSQMADGSAGGPRARAVTSMPLSPACAGPAGRRPRSASPAPEAPRRRRRSRSCSLAGQKSARRRTHLGVVVDDRDHDRVGPPVAIMDGGVSARHPV